MPKSAPRFKPMPHLTRVHQVAEQEQNYGKGRGGRPWRRKRERILKRDHWLCRCEECTSTGALKIAHEVDHIVPLAEGGRDNDDNLGAINRDCHKRKTAREAARGVGRKSRAS